MNKSLTNSKGLILVYILYVDIDQSDGKLLQRNYNSNDDKLINKNKALVGVIFVGNKENCPIRGET